MYVYVWLLQLITVLSICMYGLCPCACVAYDLIKVLLFFVVIKRETTPFVLAHDNKYIEPLVQVHL